MRPKINDALGITDEVEDDLVNEIIIEPEECTFDETNTDNDVVEDYRFIRRKLRYSIAAGEKVLENAFRNLASDPSPRVVEGCSAIIKTIADCTNQIFQIHEKFKKMNPQKNEEVIDEQGNNAKKTSVKATINEIIDAMSNDEEDFE